MGEVLTPDNDRWPDFTDELDFAVSCRGCDGRHRLAEWILDEMGDVYVASTIAAFEAHGGYCDCEILKWAMSTFRARSLLSKRTVSMQDNDPVL